MATEEETTRGFLIALLLVLALSAGVFAVRARTVTAPEAQVAASMPPLSLARLDGQVVSLAALKGQVVVIDFWATWCPPCRAEMPWLVKLAQRLEERGVTFIAVSEDDPPEQEPAVRAFTLQVPGLERFAVLGNPDVEQAYGVTHLPTLFILDRQGALVERLDGAADEATVAALVERLADRAP
jgi:thiol-disulfide isomerase/thioredoxin